MSKQQSKSANLIVVLASMHRVSRMYRTQYFTYMLISEHELADNLLL